MKYMRKQISLFKIISIVLCNLAISTVGFAQEQELNPVEKLEVKSEFLESAIKTLQKFKVSGYIQTQYQYAETDADGINFKLDKKANAYEKKEAENFGRFGIRRGRIKFTYEDGIVQGVFQPDFTEKGVSFKDVYLNIKDPWLGTNSFKAGIFDRPFGHEIAYSSSRRESPERARITQSLFPDERDLGFMLSLQAAKTSTWNFLKLEAGLFSGNGIRPQIDTRMDFIGRLSASKTIGSDISISGGISAYLGGVLQTDSSTYVMRGNKFELESRNVNNIGKYAKRQYIGFDLQFNIITVAGLTQLRGEYIFGEHPGNANGAYSFKLTDLASDPVYMRKISGGYVILTQDIGPTPFTVVAKYDWYNPNTQVSGDDINAAGSRTGAGDIALNNIGLGLLWRINAALKLTAYYDIVSNEKSKVLSGFTKDKKDNVLTVRLQYKF
jgi:phosphate-selective porin